MRESPENSGALNAQGVTLPSTGMDRWGENAPEHPTLEREGRKKKEIRNEESGRKLFSSNNVFQIRSTGIKLFLMNSSRQPHLHLICIPRGIRARVGVNPNPNSLETGCHGNLLFTRLLIG